MRQLVAAGALRAPDMHHPASGSRIQAAPASRIRQGGRLQAASVLLSLLAACSHTLVATVVSTKDVQDVGAPGGGSPHLNTPAGVSHTVGRTEPTSACAAPTVDWSQFTASAGSRGGPAAIYCTEPLTDTRLLLLAHELHNRDYSVTLLSPPQHIQAAQAYLKQARGGPLLADALKVTVVPVVVQGSVLPGPPANLFIHVAPSSGLPVVRGVGTINLLLVTSAGPGTDAPAAGSEVAGLLATYDYLLYTSSAGYVAHIPRLMPALQQLQLAGRMFPLVETLQLPAPPLSTAAAASVSQSPAGVTMSMNEYRPLQRDLLLQALRAFAAVRAQAPLPPRLILCAWLMPGLDADQDWLQKQMATLGLGPSVVEFRTVPDSPDAYGDIDVQWHIHNSDAKLHFTALAAMLAGVYVFDCTGAEAAMAGQNNVVVVPSMADLPNSTLAFLSQSHVQRLVWRIRIARQAVKPVGKALAGQLMQVVQRAHLCRLIRFFMQNTQAAYQARLTPATQQQRGQSGGRGDGGPRYAAVMIEARPHYAFLYVLLNAAWYLPGWSLHVVHSRVNAGFVRAVLAPYLTVTFHQLDADNIGIDDYNNLMKNASFWRSLNTDHVLIFQTDSLILKPGLEQFTRFDYIGAPWHLANERWSRPVLKIMLPDGVGNGGFSLRSTKAMVRICEEHGAASPLKEQEDLFFAIHVQQDPNLRIADRMAAYNFSLEVTCADLPRPEHFALHAAWYYNRQLVLQPLLDGSLRGLETVCQ